MKGIKIFLKKRKTKTVNMLVNNLEISLKNRKPRSKTIQKIFLKIKTKAS